jgi:hypothetical protein
LHDLPLAGTPSHFLLYPLENRLGNDALVVVFHIVHGAFAVVLADCFADAVCNVGFLE